MSTTSPYFGGMPRQGTPTPPARRNTTQHNDTTTNVDGTQPAGTTTLPGVPTGTTPPVQTTNAEVTGHARANPIGETFTNLDERNKRASIDPTVAPPGIKTNVSPLAAARESIVRHVESLRPEIANLLLNRGKEYLALGHRIFLKERNAKRMEADSDYIPVSARVDFRLTATKEAEELPEFTQLQDQAKIAIKEMQVALKTVIIDTAKLEAKALQDKWNKHFCESVFMATTLFNTAQGVDTAHTHYTVVRLVARHEALLKHTGLSKEEFVALYCTMMQTGNLTQEEPPDDTGDTQRIRALARALMAVFPLAFDEYLCKTRKNELSLSLKKTAKEQLLSLKSEEATMEIDAELPADRDQLKDLIRREAESMAKKLIQKEVAAALNTTTQAKNSTRGQSAQGASNKKKNGGKNTTQSPKTEAKTERGKKESGKKEGSNQRRNQNQQGRKGNKGRKGKSDQQDDDAESGSERGNKRGNKRRSNSRSRKPNRNNNRGRQQS